MTDLITLEPTELKFAQELFGIESQLKVPCFAERDEHVPEIDAAYRFNADVTQAILSGENLLISNKLPRDSIGLVCELI